MKEFHTQFKRDAEGLGDFWKAVDAGKWEEACDALIEHYSHWPPEGKGRTKPPSGSRGCRNEVEAGGCTYQLRQHGLGLVQAAAPNAPGRRRASRRERPPSSICSRTPTP